MPGRIDSRALHDLRGESEPPPSLNAGDDPLIGQLIADRYRVVRKLAEGAQASVYVAKHTLIKRLVALKVLSAAMAAERELVKRFLDEGQVAGTMGHPNIVESLDMGVTDDGRPYLVLEYLEGMSLADEVHYRGALDVGRAAYVGTQIASALVAAHGRGIIHRDLKPDNIFLVVRDEKKDHVKVLDFGISKIESNAEAGKYAGLVVGTPDYMAPEQVTAPSSVDARADIFALGACLYEALSGHAPLDASDADDALDAVVRRVPAPLLRVKPGLPQGLVSVVERAMQKDRTKRFQSMVELRSALEPFAAIPETATSMSLRAPKISGIQTLSEMGMPTSERPEQVSVSNAMLPPASSPRPIAHVSSPVPAPISSSALPVAGVSAEVPIPAESSRQLIAPVPTASLAEPMPEFRKGNKKTLALVLALVGVAGAAGYFAVTMKSTANVQAAADKAAPQVNAIAVAPQVNVPAGTPAAKTNGPTPVAAAVNPPEPVTGAKPAAKDPKKDPNKDKLAANAASEARSEPAPEEPRTVASQPAPVENTPPPEAPKAATPVATPAPAPAPAAGGVVPFGEGMTRPSPITGGEITYTREAREANVQGVMIVRCVIATSGATQNCRIIKGLPFMDQAVLSALANHKGTPVLQNGQPVAAEYTFTIRVKKD